MKILIGCSAYPPYRRGGGEISTRNLAEALASAGADVKIVTVADAASTDFVNGIEVIRLRSPNTYWSCSAKTHSRARKLLWHAIESHNVCIRKQLTQVIAHVKPAVFHTSVIEDLSPYAWKVAHEHGLPVVHTLRSYTLMCPRGTMFRKGRNCLGWCFECRAFSAPKRALSRYVQYVVGNSRSILQCHLAAR